MVGIEHSKREDFKILKWTVLHKDIFHAQKHYEFVFKKALTKI